MADQISTLTVEVNTRGTREAQDALARLGINAKAAEVAAKKYVSETQRNEKAQRSYAAAQKTATQSIVANTAAQNASRSSFGMMRGGLQNLSYQLQDVAVQAQMGTDGLRILSMQGPQIASVFGPGGAVVGAIVAFGALFTGTLVNAFSEGEQSSDQFDKALNRLKATIKETSTGTLELSRHINELASKNKQAAVAELTTLMATARQQLFQTQKEMKGLLDESGDLSTLPAALEEIKRSGLTPEDVFGQTGSYAQAGGLLANVLDNFGKPLGLSREQAFGLAQAIANVDPNRGATFDPVLQQLDSLVQESSLGNTALFDLRSELTELKQQADQAGDALSFVRRARRELREGGPTSLDPITEGTEELEASFEAQLNAALDADLKQEEQAKAAAARRLDQIRLAAMDQATVIAELAQREREQLDQDLANKLISETEHADAIVQLREATEKRLGQVAERSAQEEARRDAMRAAAKVRLEQYIANSRQALMQQTLGFVRDAFGEESAMYKAMFVASQALAIAQTIISSQTAAMAALAPPPVGLGPVAGAPYAAAIRMMGAVSAGLIAAQTFVGFSGGRASGGQVRGGETYLVGERGPELLTMGTSGRVASNDQLKKAMGGGESIQIVNNIDARGSGPEVETKIQQAMRETSEITIAKIQDLMRRRRFV